MLNQGRLACLKVGIKNCFRQRILVKAVSGFPDYALFLKAREDHLHKVLDEARANLSRISNNKERYPAILKGLILQVYYAFLNFEYASYKLVKLFLILSRLCFKC